MNAPQPPRPPWVAWEELRQPILRTPGRQPIRPMRAKHGLRIPDGMAEQEVTVFLERRCMEIESDETVRAAREEYNAKATEWLAMDRPLTPDEVASLETARERYRNAQESYVEQHGLRDKPH